MLGTLVGMNKDGKSIPAPLVEFAMRGATLYENIVTSIQTIVDHGIAIYVLLCDKDQFLDYSTDLHSVFNDCGVNVEPIPLPDIDSHDSFQLHCSLRSSPGTVDKLAEILNLIERTDPK